MYVGIHGDGVEGRNNTTLGVLINQPETKTPGYGYIQVLMTERRLSSYQHQAACTAMATCATRPKARPRLNQKLVQKCKQECPFRAKRGGSYMFVVRLRDELDGFKSLLSDSMFRRTASEPLVRLPVTDVLVVAFPSFASAIEE
jgi:hypothetical protein